jgi:hypothetical protein
MSCGGGTLLGVSQRESEKKGRSFGGARRMNAATQTAGQFGDNRQPSAAPERFMRRAIIRDPALYDVACKHQFHSQFRMSGVESRMSCHIGQQLGYDQPKLPASFSFKLQIVRRKQDTYRQAFQSIFRHGEAKLLEVLRDIGKAFLIRHAQRPMNIGALVQEVHHIEQRGFDRHVIRLHRTC